MSKLKLKILLRPLSEQELDGVRGGWSPGRGRCREIRDVGGSCVNDQNQYTTECDADGDAYLESQCTQINDINDTAVCDCGSGGSFSVGGGGAVN